MNSARYRVPILVWALCAGFGCVSAGPGLTSTAKAPEWVERSGNSVEFPNGKFLVGFAQAAGDESAVESAKQQAVADLARQITVQIESTVVDVVKESDGRLNNDLTSQIRSTSDIRLEGIRFETYRKRSKVWAIAVLERLPASVRRRKERDAALAMTKRCLDAAAELETANRASQALDTYRSCRTPLNEALEHEAVAAALQRGGLLQDEAGVRLAEYASLTNTRIRAIPHQDATTIRAAAEGLAAQLAQASIGPGRNLQVAPLLYQGRDISSPFGRELAIALESAIGRSSTRESGGGIAVRGTYREGKNDFQIRVNAKDAGSGNLIASAEIALAKSAVPSSMETRPANFERFAADADKLNGGEVVSGDLRVEVRTDKGLRGIVYEEGDEITLFVRVNQPAWIRLIYVLTTGELVPITQGWYIDETQVNQLVEYPTAFEIVAPFGVEMIHAMASNQMPEKMITTSTQIDGEPYDVIAEGTDQVVRSRGIARKKKQHVAEQTLQLTTMRKPY